MGLNYRLSVKMSLDLRLIPIKKHPRVLLLVNEVTGLKINTFDHQYDQQYP